MKSFRDSISDEKKFIDDDSPVVTIKKKKKLDNYTSARLKKPLTDGELSEIATNLINKPVDNRDVRGYISIINGEKMYNKYDKDTGVFVCYNAFDIIVNYCVKTIGQYEGDKAFEYYDEIG